MNFFVGSFKGKLSNDSATSFRVTRSRASGKRTNGKN